MKERFVTLSNVFECSKGGIAVAVKALVSFIVKTNAFTIGRDSLFHAEESAIEEEQENFSADG
ncbi:hypothetical protein [Tengunoibacter tsumagoiensis]|uniref:Uncharacterized protein n=1 Tax=Tengunoibacter tsumagoiensis TaxID=2014871 RepID=A0A401ZUD2_9CHLR|nr:hypothetical protein [Tengunoibacter tsumagoiensis]GCE10481.1 hypothetical protein KTT_03400 [Tengunoibacter tsumagoiensis]